MNPKAMKQAMKKMGMKQEEVPATEVIIKTPNSKDIIIRNPKVMLVEMMGEESFQITGDVDLISPMNENDVKTVMEQAHCSEEEAKAALEKADGDLAEAILNLQS